MEISQGIHESLSISSFPVVVAEVREWQKTTTIVLLQVSLTSSPIQSLPGISEEAPVSQRMTEIFQNASFSDLFFPLALESADALSLLYHPTATSEPDGDSMVVTTLPGE